ncbi:MAG: AtpZ/AtpI family protein [Burkholderiales bacterium]|nr:AtpZ/AtpI family protein [Burkholderiales bacterium]
MMDIGEQLRRKVEQQAKRMKQAEEERFSLLAQSVYLGTLAVLFVLPVVAGAYLGNWLDNQASGYSFRWTVSLILLGIATGALNVYLFVREHG